jgi:transposase
VELYGRVRRAVGVEGRSQRAVAKEFGLSRETVRKMLQYAVPPGYQRQQPIKRPKLGPWLGVIDAILSDDKQRPAKQQHTAKRIFDRLKDEHQFTGGYTIVKDYVRSAKDEQDDGARIRLAAPRESSKKTMLVVPDSTVSHFARTSLSTASIGSSVGLSRSYKE